MDYPGNFETPAFPAGPRIALSRVMAVWTLIAFFIIICLCGLLLWSAASRRLDPFMISINGATGTWTIVGRNGPALEYSAVRTIQESVVGKYVTNWFRISGIDTEDNAAWRKCNREECASGDALLFGTRLCAIYCGAGDDVFSQFTYNVLDDYMERSGRGETWAVDPATLSITPAGDITDAGGTFRVRATVLSSAGAPMQIQAFVKVARNTKYYPSTMGFYIAAFNAYRMN
ncbi:MAG: hypothetical protein K2L95_02735 [Alphaproteobacteria bacterium]|nr:hypothetical protein [Alphaproteobacteria bacterium]